VACELCPIASDTELGVTAIDASVPVGAVTRKVSTVEIPPLLALIFAEPTPTPLITPVADTVTIVEFSVEY
jgi:hypothetical protein